MGRPGLTRHRKFLRLSRMLDDLAPGFGEVVARGCLESLWDACYESGESYLGDADDVEAMARWKGKRGELCRALLESGGDGHAGFIEQTVEGRYQLHDLWDHAPDYVRKRRQREVERRQTGDNLRSLSGQGTVTDRTATGHCPPNGETRTPAPAPAPAYPTTSAEPQAATAPEVTLPCVGEGPREYGVTQEQLDRWGGTHPGLDVRREVLLARDWLVANPTRRKTHRGCERFLVNWLGRAQDRGRGGTTAKPKDIRIGMAPAAAHAEFGEGEGARDVQF